MDSEEYDSIIRHLVTMMVKQDKINDSQESINGRLTDSIERLDINIERINITLARVEMLLDRIIPQSENGREA